MDNIKLLKKLLLEKEIKSENVLALIPELKPCINCSQKNPAHQYDVFQHIIKVVEGLEQNFDLRLVGLLHDIGKPKTKVIIDDIEHFGGHEEKSVEISRIILNRFGFDEKYIEKICRLIRFHDYKTTPTSEGVKNAINIVGYDIYEDLLKCQTSDVNAHSKACIARVMPKIKKIKEIYYTQFEQERID